jgi:hypothetical protein
VFVFYVVLYIIIDSYDEHGRPTSFYLLSAMLFNVLYFIGFVKLLVEIPVFSYFFIITIFLLSTLSYIILITLLRNTAIEISYLYDFIDSWKRPDTLIGFLLLLMITAQYFYIFKKILMKFLMHTLYDLGSNESLIEKASQNTAMAKNNAG